MRLARRSALKARTQAANQLHALVPIAPEPVRARLRGLAVSRLVAVAAACRPGVVVSTLLEAIKLTLKCLARRYQRLSAEITALDAHLTQLVAATAPAVLTIKALGHEAASALRVVAGANPNQLRSETAFTRLCGVAPLPASSGKTHAIASNAVGIVTPIGRCTCWRPAR